jgi:hypothetical protein
MMRGHASRIEERELRQMNYTVSNIGMIREVEKCKVLVRADERRECAFRALPQFC